MPDDLTRRAFLERSGIAALGATGLYALIDGVEPAPARAAIARSALPPEQHLMQGQRVITHQGVRVNVPPLHHQVVTAELAVARTGKALREARRALEAALLDIEKRHPPTPSGLGVVVAWGAPYFREYVPALHGHRYPDYLPLDLQASKAAGANVRAFFDTERFPSDPSRMRLESNALCVVFQSDSLEVIGEESKTLFKALAGLVVLTSVRKGFVGGGFGSAKRSLVKEMAMKAHIAGAESIPDRAQLFLGFTSTQHSSLGPDRIANFETLPGMTDQWPNGYFRNGTTMHLSHLSEDVGVWYGNNSFPQRVWLSTDLGRDANALSDQTLTLPEGPTNVQSEELVQQFATDPENGMVGHSASIQPVNRLQSVVRDNYGITRPKGTAILQRIDFNTLDNPFFWSSRPGLDRHSGSPSAGMHFLAFAPTSDFFRRMRLAMDGRYADGVRLPLLPTSDKMGLNSMIHATHRQHFLVPPRRSRSFPLSELL